jgi:plastocyanin
VHKRWGAAALILSLLFVPLSCFSERDGSGPVDVTGDCRIPQSAIGANKVIVAIRDFSFFPDTVRIRPGTEVTWVNCETNVQDFHTSTSSTNAWDSGALNRGEFFTRRFDANGSFEYFCVPHPFMRGAVIVQ